MKKTKVNRTSDNPTLEPDSSGYQSGADQQISILIVDDHPAMRSTMYDILEDEGFSPQVAADGEEALRLCMEGEFDFVLMDVQMPDSTGVETFRRIKKAMQARFENSFPVPYSQTSNVTAKTPRFIFMSAYSVSELKEECYRLGAIAFLQKPLDMDEVIHLIRDRSNPSVLLFMEDKKARDASAKALRSSNFRVITTESLDQVLINARQISHRFVVIESGIVEMDEDAIKTMLGQVSPFSQLVVTDSNEKPTVLLEELSRLRASPVRRETATSGW
jgi:CheY-like chemotaxis protein